ncbi:MAG TPA: hypothetical protein DEA05_13755, partial [Rhodobacteraceae bacterium]|nr:hypothetical protein [Paracoccaceae bacterium]
QTCALPISRAGDSTEFAHAAALFFQSRKDRKLREAYEHHIDEEEEDLFARAREVLSRDEIDRAGPAFDERKEEERGLIAEKRAEALEE